MLKFATIAALLAPAFSLNFNDAQKNILGEISINGFGMPLCESYTCCNVSLTEHCDISGMPKDETTLVLPGGDTRCIYGDSTPYAFQVIPGDSDKLLFYFQGGGACWDEVSTKAGFCTSDSSPASLSGIFDRGEEKNRYKDHTIVHVLYCSGDVWGGDTVRPYDDSTGEPVTQKGLANAQAALDWVLQQTEAGHLASTLSELTVSGCSAGSVGAQLWGKPITDTLKWEKAAVVPDSYAGIFPPGSEGPLIKDFGFCEAKWLSETIYESCMAETLSLREINLDGIGSSPNIPYSFIQSKTDIVQQSFYVAIGATTPNVSAAITPEQFYDDVNELFGVYNAALPNFVTYLVNGDQHCFTPASLYYTADPLGSKDDGEDTDSQMMYQWVNSLPLSSDASIETKCDGEIEYPEDSTAVAGKMVGNAQTYCSSGVTPKTFTEHWN